MRHATTARQELSLTGYPGYFYVRKQLLLSARLSHRKSVRLSVTRVDQSKKKCKLGSPNFHRWLPRRL